MYARLLICAAVLGSWGCTGGIAAGFPGGPAPDVVVVDEPGTRGSPRALRGVPPGHYPPPGECRLWYPGRPPGHQPPPTRCGNLSGHVPYGAFILYNAKAWDTTYDWHRHARRDPGSVPELVLELVASVRK